MEITCPNCEHRFFATTRRVQCERCTQEFDVWAVLGAIDNGVSRQTVPLGGVERDLAQTGFAATSDEVLELPDPAPIEASAPETSPVLDETFSALPPEALAKLNPMSTLGLTVTDHHLEAGAPTRRNWIWGVSLAAIVLITGGGYYLLDAFEPPTDRSAIPAASAAIEEKTSGTGGAAGAAPSVAGTTGQLAAQQTTQQPDESAAKSRPGPKPAVDAPPPAPAEPPASEPTSRPRIVTPADQPSGNFALQVAARPSETEAREIAARLRDSGASVRLVRAELPGRGTWYRVQVGAFATRAEADRYGAQMKRAGTIEDYFIADLRPR